MSSKNDRPPRAVHFGAGKIGRGFLAQLLSEGGYTITFVDIDAPLVAALNSRSTYPLRLVSTDSTQNLTVRNYNALDARESGAVREALVQADLVSTAVGASNLPQLAGPLAAGIHARAHAHGGPLNILFCENQWHAAYLMEQHIAPLIAAQSREYFQRQVGLVETIVGRAVPAPTADTLAEDPLLIVAEPEGELLIARPMLRGPIPALSRLYAVDDIDAYEARKLYLHNTGHAALAYLGYERGYKYLWQCVGDLQVAALCRRALDESAQALAAEFDFTCAAMSAFIDDLMRRFANRALGDTVSRVAADPTRKLRPQDRLVGPAMLCVKHDILPAALAQVIAAALRYNNPADLAAQDLQARRAADSDRMVLAALCGLAPDSSLSHMILSHLR